MEQTFITHLLKKLSIATLDVEEVHDIIKLTQDDIEQTFLTELVNTLDVNDGLFYAGNTIEEELLHIGDKQILYLSDSTPVKDAIKIECTEYTMDVDVYFDMTGHKGRDFSNIKCSGNLEYEFDDFLKENNIPTKTFSKFSNLEALEYLCEKGQINMHNMDVDHLEPSVGYSTVSVKFLLLKINQFE